MHISCTPQIKFHSILDWVVKIQKSRQSLEEHKYYNLPSYMLKRTQEQLA